MSKKMSKKFKLKCFYALNYIMAFMFIMSACCLDGDGWVAEILCGVSLMYLGFALYITNKAEEMRGGR